MRKNLPIKLVAFVVLLSVILSACAGGTNTAQQPAGEAAASSQAAGGQEAGSSGLSGTVRVAYAGGEAEDGVNEITGMRRRSFATVFEESFTPKFPDVKVEITCVPWTDYEAQIQAMLMSNNVDVIGSGGSENMFYNQGLLLELDDLLANDSDFKPEELFIGSAWFDNVFNTSPDGKRYGLPAVIGYRMIVYDKLIFDDWGVEYLSNHPTPEEVLEKAEKMTGTNPKTGVQNYGLWFEGNNLANSLYTTLGIYYDAPGFTGNRADGFKTFKMEFNTPNAVKIFEYIEKAVKFANPAIAMNSGGESLGLEDNAVAIYLEASPRIIIPNYIKSGKTDTSMIERFVPTMNFGPNGEGWVACDNIVIAKNANNLEASWEVAKFLVSYDFFKYCYEDIFWLTPLKPEVADYIDPKDIYTQTALEIAKFGSVNAHDYLPELNTMEITPFVAGFVAQCVNNQNPTPQEAADNLQARAERWQSSLK